jgi:hypothetical protein
VAAGGAVVAAAAGATSFPGSITPSDPTHSNFVLDQSPPSSCASPKPALVGSDPAQIHYDTYTQTSGATTCYTISLSVGAAANRAAYSIAYQGSFNPLDLSANYLGDIGVANGVQPGQTRSYSVQVPGGSTLVAVVEELMADPAALPYTLDITGGVPTTARLAGFHTRASRAGVVVTWRTTNETDAAAFEVYRERGGTLTRVGKPVAAKRTGSPAGASYRVLDPLSSPGRTTYKLQALQLDGTRPWVALSALSR